MSKPVVGAQLYTIRDFTNTIEDVRESLKKIADIGYTTVQISGFGPVDMAEVAQICDGEGLEVCATHTGWQRFQDELDQVIEEHKILGCKHPAIGGLPAEYNREKDGVQKFIDELTPIAEKLAAEGMDFSYHNHAHELIQYDGKTWLEMVYEQAPADILKAEIDTYWIQAGGGDPAQWINHYPGRQPLVHFKDMTMGAQGQVFAEIGEGNLNWDAIIEACKSSGVEYALVEQDNCYERDPFEALAMSYNNLKAMGLS